MSIAAVYAANRILSEGIAMLPFEVYERIDAENSKLAFSHPTYSLINENISEYTSSFSWRDTTQYHIGLDGNGYSWIQFDGSGRPIELIILDPRQVDVRRDKYGRISYYTSEYNRVLLQSEVFHVKGMSFDGMKGLSPIKAHKETLGLSIAGTKFANVVYKNGGHIRGVLETDKEIGEDAKTYLARTFSDVYSGVDRAAGTPVLEDGLKYKRINLSPQDVEYIKAMQFQISEVARIYRVPPHMLQDLTRASFNNVETMSQEFVTFSLMPWIKRWEQEVQLKLFRPDERRRYYARLNVDGLLRGDTKARAEYYTKMFYIGAMSQNDIRRKENMNPIDGGDQYFVQSNMVAAEIAKLESQQLINNNNNNE